MLYTDKVKVRTFRPSSACILPMLCLHFGHVLLAFCRILRDRSLITGDGRGVGVGGYEIEKLQVIILFAPPSSK